MTEVFFFKNLIHRVHNFFVVFLNFLFYLDSIVIGIHNFSRVVLLTFILDSERTEQKKALGLMNFFFIFIYFYYKESLFD